MFSEQDAPEYPALVAPAPAPAAAVAAAEEEEEEGPGSPAPSAEEPEEGIPDAPPLNPKWPWMSWQDAATSSTMFRLSPRTLQPARTRALKSGKQFCLFLSSKHNVPTHRKLS